ncbi:MAG: response regulator [Gemmatimonadales bacterium]|nr:response regulator [Gemmatimonadales bacterium]
MSRLVILCIEDEDEVRDAVVRDLEVFEPTFLVEMAEDAADARQVVEEVAAAGDETALVIADHRLPGMQGTDFLIELHSNPDTATARKVLLTGQAGHEDTIRAINQADLDHYISKPWTEEELHSVVREQLTEYVLRNVDDVLPYVAMLDGQRLLERLARDTL